MKASRFPREYIGFEIKTQKFLSPEELLTRGVTITGDGLPYFKDMPFEFIILWFSGQKDKENHKLYEGDICQMDVKNEFGSMTQEKAMMQWNAETSQFILKMGSPVANQYLTVSNVIKLGHELTHPDLALEIINKAKKI